MNSQVRHKPFCFAGQPAPCAGYFPGDVLPCVCGAIGYLLEALGEAAAAAPAGGEPALASNDMHGSTSRRGDAA